eukprot:1193607-Rhodomonas_salina.1
MRHCSLEQIHSVTVLQSSITLAAPTYGQNHHHPPHHDYHHHHPSELTRSQRLNPLPIPSTVSLAVEVIASLAVKVHGGGVLEAGDRSGARQGRGGGRGRDVRDRT